VAAQPSKRIQSRSRRTVTPGQSVPECAVVRRREQVIDVAETFGPITEAAAVGLDVERTSIWRLLPELFLRHPRNPVSSRRTHRHPHPRAEHGLSRRARRRTSTW
jgi:hypothetical protein